MTQVYKLVICEEDRIVLETPIPFEVMESVASMWPDSENYTELFELLAEHPCHLVRSSICSKSSLSENTVNKLVKDTSLDVLRYIVDNDVFRSIANEETVLDLIGKDQQIAYSLANSFGFLKNINAPTIAERLMQSKDPAILTTLADNGDTPRRALQVLAKHPDPRVACRAKDTLKQYQ